ncbi:MAG: metallophosphoesterase family protein [Peptoniphilaceae bacterium]
MKILHTADLHLARFYRGALPKEKTILRREELWKSFENTVEYINNNKIEIFLLCGDIYEREYFTDLDMKRFRDILNTLKNTEIFIIGGNHDYIDKDSPINQIEFNDNVHIFREEEYFQIDKYNLRVYGLSWDKPFDYKSEIDFNIDKNFKNILMLHGSTISKSHFYLEKDKLEKLGFDYIALGHIHIRQKIGDNIYYAGSPEPVSFKDLGEHGFIEISLLNEKIDINFKGESIRKYLKHDLKIEAEDNLIEIESKIINVLKGNENNFNYLELTGYYKDPNYLLDYLNTRLDYFYLDIVNNLRPFYNLDNLYRENKDNILGKFILESKDDPEMLDYGIRALMEAKNED